MARNKWLIFGKSAGGGRRGLILLGLVAAILGGAGRAEAGYASFVMDADSGQVVHSDAADARNHPASLTKMMTLYLVFEALESGRLKMTTALPVSAHATAQAPSKLNLAKGQSIKVEDAILALVTKSANDVACVIAEAIGGTEPEFARMMTATAQRLGMNRTEFRNASGLPNSAQITSARDMAVLARALIRHYPQYYHYFSTRQFRYNDIVINTHNRLMLSYEGADGLKTGYIGASGFNLVSSAKRDGKRLIGVVLGGRTAKWRDQHMADLLDASFARINDLPVPATARVKDIPVAGMDAPPKAKNDKKGKPARLVALKPPMPLASASTTSDAEVDVVLEEMAKGAPKVKGIAAKPSVRDPAKEWGIQVGSYRQSQQARAAATAALGKLKEAAPVAVVPDRQKGKTVYRARLVGMTKQQAQKACSRLAKKKSACQIVAPTGDVTLAEAR